MVANEELLCLIETCTDWYLWSMLIYMARTFWFGADVSFSLLKRKLDHYGCGCSERKKEM